MPTIRETRESLSSTFAPVISLAGRGVSHTATAAQNTALIQAAVIEAEATGRAVVFPAVPAGQWIDINDRILIATGGITVTGHGIASRVRQTAFPKPIFEVLGADTTIERINGTTSAFDATAHHGAFRGATAQTYNAVVWAAANGTVVRHVNASNTYSAVYLSSYDVAGAAEGAPLTRCEVHHITVTDCVFGLLYGIVDGFTFSHVKGNYKYLTGASTPPHLVYSTSHASLARNKGVIGSDCYASNGESSFAYQFKYDDGGQFSNLSARNSLGALHIMESVNSRFSNLSFIDDLTATATIAAVEFEGTNDNITIDGMLVTMSGKGKPFRFNTTTSNSTLRNATTIANHTDAASDADDVELIGTANTVENVRAANVGSTAWGGSISLWSGSGHRILRPRTAGNINGVRARASGTGRIEDYDVDECGYTTGKALSIGNAGTVVRPRTTPAAMLGTTNLLAYDLCDRLPGGSAYNSTSGHAWTWLGSATFAQDTAGRMTNNSAATNAKATLDVGKADVRIGAGITYQNREGLLVRAVDATNFVMFRPGNGAGSAEIHVQVAGVNNVRATASFTPTVGRRYTIAVTAYGNVITAFIDGTQVATYTLTGDEVTALATCTKHGVFATGATGNTGYFDSIEIRALN